MEKVSLPVIAKPNTGGSSMGIRETCRTASASELRRAADWILRDCGDSVLVEAFVSGREVDCGLLEAPELRVLPLAEMRLDGGKPEAFNSIENKSRHRREILCPAPLPEGAARRIEAHAVSLYRALGCRDLARADFRVGADGAPQLLEINPLPGLSPFRSAYPVLVRAAGMEPEEVIRQLVDNALRRA
jgi:D-alanine-D-alanine ligase